VRSYVVIATRRWPNAVDIEGDGPIAVLTHCRVLKVSLHPTMGVAEKVLDLVNRTSCGGHCWRDHEIVVLYEEMGS
jgi:hypothetical protein